MYELPDFSAIEKVIPWGWPQGDIISIVVGSLILVGFFFVVFAVGIRFTQWLAKEW